GQVSLPEGLRWLAREPLPGTRVSPGRALVARPGAPLGDTCLSRMGSGGSPGSPSRGHVSLPEGLRWLAMEPLPGTPVSPGRAPVARPGAPPGDTWLSRKGSGGLAFVPLRRTRVLPEKEKKRKEKGKATTSSS